MNPYRPIPMKVRDIYFETTDRMLKSIDLEFVNKQDEFDYLPGQFCEFSIYGKGEAPFGIATSPTEKGYLKFTVNRAGLVTTAIHYLTPGELVGVRGPLGNYYPVEEFKGKNIVIIGGGFAFTTLRSLTIYILEHRKDYGNLTVFYGVRNPGLFLYKEELKKWKERKDMELHLTVDVGDESWKGFVGVVPKLVEEVGPSSTNAYAVVCGPPIMIRFTLPVVEKLGFPKDRVYLSLERRMKCGIGKCGRCNIGKYYVCKDGPVFNLAQLEPLPKEY